MAPTLPPAIRPARSPRHGRGSLPPVRLDLSGALVSLESNALAELRAELRTTGISAGRTPHPVTSPAPAPAPAPVPPAARPQVHVPGADIPGLDIPRVPDPGVPAPGVPAPVVHVPAAGPTTAGTTSPSVTTSLEVLAARSPVAAELSALLRDTADTAAALITAGARRTAPATVSTPAGPPLPAPPPRALPTAPRRPAPTGVSPPVPRAHLPQTPVPPTDRPHPTHAPAPAPATLRTHRQEHRSTLRVSPETMPYLLDHCFFPQRPGWPDVADRWPVVPATTIVRHMMDARRADGRPGCARWPCTTPASTSG